MVLPGKQRSGMSLRILVAEDNADIANLLRLLSMYPLPPHGEMSEYKKGPYAPPVSRKSFPIIYTRMVSL